MQFQDAHGRMPSMEDLEFLAFDLEMPQASEDLNPGYTPPPDLFGMPCAPLQVLVVSNQL